MPGLVLFGRRWHVASDDMALPSCIESCVRIAWLIGVGVVVFLYRDDITPNPGCLFDTSTPPLLLLLYFIFLVVVLLLHVLLNSFIGSIASRGAIMDEGPRRKIPHCLYVKLLLWVVELGLVCLGTYLAFGVPGLAEECHRTVYWTVRVLALAGWMLMIFLLIGFIVTFDPLGKHGNHADAGEIKQLWEGRCRFMCVGSDCCTKRKENVFQNISLIFTQFFGGLDLVLSDLIAGLILLYNTTADGKTTLLGHPTNVISPAHVNAPLAPASSSSRDLPPSHAPAAWMTMSSAAHYIRYALGSYGWMLYTFTHPCTGLCRLIPHCLCCGCLRGARATGDYCCQCEHAAILKQTDMRRHDVIFASFYNWVEEIPFYVCYDHQHKAVVVAIRGTLSLKDALTDANAQTEDVQVPGASAHQQVHQGIQGAARYIYATLQEHQILESALRHTGNYADYQLVITGHSLGAGAAALLAILLKPEYPQLHCYSFSPPGWLVSAELQRISQEYVMSVVLGDDLVPRMGLLTLEKMKVEILLALKYCHHPKHDVLLTGCNTLLCGRRNRDGDQTLDAGDTCPAATGKDLEMIDRVVKESEAFQAAATPLYMPGCVLYIEETSDDNEQLFTCRWRRAEEFDRILISAQMVLDHMPDKVLDALEYCATIPDTS